MTSVRVREEWRARIAAEYTSAAITQHLVLWLIQAGAPPDLIDAGLAIVNDELVHSRLSHEVYVAAGGTEPPAIVREQLGLTRTAEQLEIDILRIAVRVFCLGETVAVPLFKHLRERCTQPIAKVALDRILRYEVRHRDFGWDLLDWLMSTPLGDNIPAMVAAGLHHRGRAGDQGQGGRGHGPHGHAPDHGRPHRCLGRQLRADGLR